MVLRSGRSSKDPEFENSMNKVELEAWKAFVLVVKNFLGNNKGQKLCRTCQQHADCFQKPGLQHEYQDALPIFIYGPVF